MQDGIFQKIDAQYENLSGTFKKIADYLRMNPRELYISSASELARKIGTSDASIVRFCQKLGYSGYDQFREVFARNGDDRSAFNDIADRLNDIGSSREYIERAFQHEFLTLNETIRSFDFPSLKEAVDAIKKASLVYIVGLGSCSILAVSLYYYLDRMQLRCRTITTSGFLMAEQLCNMQKEDVLLLISYPGYSVDSRSALEIAKKHGARTILMTDKKRTPLTRIADIVLVAPAKNPYLFYNSYTGAFALCNMLVLEYAFRDYDRNIKWLGNIKEISRPYKI